MAQLIIFTGKDGNTSSNMVPDGDLSYWLSQPGWSLPPGVANPVAGAAVSVGSAGATPQTKQTATFQGGQQIAQTSAPLNSSLFSDFDSFKRAVITKYGTNPNQITYDYWERMKANVEWMNKLPSVPAMVGKIDLATGSPFGQTEKKFTDVSELPGEIRNNPLFKKLDADQQEVLAGSWKAMQAGSILTQIRWNEAMKDATKLADPIFKAQIRLAQDQLERSITSLIANNTSARQEIDTKIADLREDLKTRGERFTAEQFEQKLRDMEGLNVLKDQAMRSADSREAQVGADIHRIKNRIEDIEGDLETRKGDITIEEEKALSRQLRQYKDELKQTQQSVVNAGLGFSSIREEAEQRLKEELQDISDSTRRQAARQIRDIELETGRGKRDLGLQREDIERKNQEARLDLARDLEQRIGFENIPENIRSVLGESFAALKTREGERVRSEIDVREQERQRKTKQEQEDIERVRVRAERERETALTELERERKEKLTAGVREGEATLGTANLPTLATQEVKPLGETPLQGTLEQQQTERILAIRKSLLESQPLFSSQL